MKPSGRNQWQNRKTPRKRRNQAKTVATGCGQLPWDLDGKGVLPPRTGGVASLAPQEAPSPANPKAHKT
jgi:hypothetical protein